MLSGVLGPTQRGVHHRKSFVKENNIAVDIKECNNVLVAAKERRKKKNKYKGEGM